MLVIRYLMTDRMLVFIHLMTDTDRMLVIRYLMTDRMLVIRHLMTDIECW